MDDIALFLTDDIKSFRKLSGFSGAEILLCTRDHKNWFVRKIAKDSESSPRLQLQITKQISFSQQIDHLIKTPEVLNEGKINNIYYADMSFISGPDGIYFLRTANLDQIKSFNQKLNEYIKIISTVKLSTDSINTNALIEKITNIHSKYPEIVKDKTILKIINILLQINKLNLPTTLNHGDCTLENIIVSNRGEIYFLDLLDAPINNWIMDVSKLCSDLDAGWYARKTPLLPRYVVEYLHHQILTTTKDLLPEYSIFYFTLLFINLMRIVPYAHQQSDKDLLIDRLNWIAGNL